MKQHYIKIDPRYFLMEKSVTIYFIFHLSVYWKERCALSGSRIDRVLRLNHTSWFTEWHISI